MRRYPKPASGWPAEVPPGLDDRDAAACLARQVRALALDGPRRSGPLEDLRAVCRAAGARYSEASLGGREGGVEAMLAPLDGDRFAIVVDPTPRGGWARVPRPLRPHVRRQRLRFRVGHELGHTFFYERGGDRPRLAVTSSPRQEAFCDSFSRMLLVSTDAARRTTSTPAAVLGLSRRFDVSLEVAARAIGDAQPDTRLCLWWWPSGGEPVRQWGNDNDRLCPAEERELADRSARRGARALWLAGRRQLLSVIAPA